MLRFGVVFLCALSLAIAKASTLDNALESKPAPPPSPCMCGIFLSGQFTGGNKDKPAGEPCLTQEPDGHFINNSIGNRQCMNKCLETIIPHLTKSDTIICATVGRDVHKEKAFLFMKNHGAAWLNTNMSMGRLFCCKDHAPYKCPLV